MDKQTANEWDLLGFYYEYEQDLKQWRFLGSKEGLLILTKIITAYGSKLSNQGLSEHIHIGPYSYLKIMTWNEAIVTDNYIGGTIDDLMRLSKLIIGHLSSAFVGSVFKILSEYSEKSSVSLLFIIMADSFRPSSIEFQE